MNPLLVILNPRRIREALDSYEALPIDRLHILGHTEHDIEEAWPQILTAAAGYSHLVLISDDAVVEKPEALSRVLDMVEDGWPVATGYSNLSEADQRANLSSAPLEGSLPSKSSYVLPTVAEVQAKHGAFPTYFAGLCLTAMHMDLWHRFPFQAYGTPGFASDYNLCLRLQDEHIPIACHPESFVRHIKATWSEHDPTPGRELHLGDREIRLVKHGG